MSIPSFGEGSGYYTGGPGPHGGSVIPRGSGPPREVRSLRLLGLERLLLLEYVVLPDLSQPGDGSGTVVG